MRPTNVPETRDGSQLLGPMTREEETAGPHGGPDERPRNEIPPPSSPRADDSFREKTQTAKRPGSGESSPAVRAEREKLVREVELHVRLLLGIAIVAQQVLVRRRIDHAQRPAQLAERHRHELALERPAVVRGLIAHVVRPEAEALEAVVAEPEVRGAIQLVIALHEPAQLVDV